MANRFEVSNDNPYPGETITISLVVLVLHDTQQTITITNPVTQQTEAHLVDMDQDGRGCFTWQVPTGWSSAVLSHPWSADHVVIVVT